VADPSSLISLEVVTRTGVALRAEVDEVQAPSVAGEFGVLPGHLPLLAALKSGVLSYRARGELKRGVIGPGFAEVGPDKCLVLCEHWVPEDSIDPVLTKTSLDEERATIERLQSEGTTTGSLYTEHMARIDWLEAQLALAELWAPGRKNRAAGTSDAAH
jgi:F-type H+-transporting ATPase subunit epsilon